MFDDVITLLNIVTKINDYGDKVEDTEKTTRIEVFAKVQSVKMTEKYKALAVGLEPELVFVLSDYYDYSDEKVIEYEGHRYKILRTYRKEDSTELELVVVKDGST